MKLVIKANFLSKDNDAIFIDKKKIKIHECGNISFNSIYLFLSLVWH